MYFFSAWRLLAPALGRLQNFVARARWLPAACGQNLWFSI